MLLGYLRDSTAEFCLQGSHYILSLVRLPPWLPRQTVEKMVIQFQYILCQEIVFMMQQGSSPPHGRSSIKRDSGFSASSSETASPVEESFPHKGSPNSKQIFKPT